MKGKVSNIILMALMIIVAICAITFSAIIDAYMHQTNETTIDEEAHVEPVITIIYLNSTENYTSENNTIRYTPEDIELLAKMVWGEARGLNAEEQALCVWTVLNRLDYGGFGDSIRVVVTAKGQFNGYRAETPVEQEIIGVVAECLYEWNNGATAPVLPPYAYSSDCMYFTGDGQHNYFKEG